MSNARRIQRVLAEKNYNQDLSPNYKDYGFKSEADMHIKIAQANALYQYGINKEAFIGPLVQNVKNAFTAGQTAAQAAGTSGVLGGLKSVGANAVQGAKNITANAYQGAKEGVKNFGENVKNTYQTGAANATSAGTSPVMGGIKSLGQATWNNPYGQAALVSGGIGALTSAMSPVQEGESRLGNMARGAIGGAATGAAFVGLQKGMTALGNKAFNGAPAAAAGTPVAPVAPVAPPVAGHSDPNGRF